MKTRITTLAQLMSFDIATNLIILKPDKKDFLTFIKELYKGTTFEISTLGEKENISSSKIIEPSYDNKGNAKHYMEDRIETIVKMERIWGTYETMVFVEMNAFKYRERLNKKTDQPIEQELLKIKWYESKAKELSEKIGTKEEIKY